MKSIKPLIECISRKRCGEDFGLCYNPEFLAVGSVIRDFLNPDVVLIGESDPKSGELLSEIYRTVCHNSPPIVRTDIYNAELAKISLNTFITMKISFANIIAEICERIPAGDVDVVSRILGFDSRIGRKYLTGGLAYGGPCFPRDNRAFSSFTRRIGCKAKLPEVTDRVNMDQINRMINLVKQKLGHVKDKKVAFLGLTYKPNTDIVEPSAPVEIAKALLQEGAEVSVYDPSGTGNARRALGESNVKYADSAERCLVDAEFCILATAWEEFSNLKPEDFSNTMKKPALLDCWRIFDRTEFSKKLEYMAIGLGPQYED
jgi:UDPglucose 6-dehydrogenase